MNSKCATVPAVRVLVTVAGGGFFWQSKSVACELAGDFELHYATAEPAKVWIDSGLPAGIFHEVCGITTQTKKAWFQRATNFLKSALAALAVVRRVDPDAIVCTASSIAVPLCIWGKAFGKQTIFIESITRVSHPSSTGKILDRLGLCDRIYVQWPEAVGLYRNAVYRGTLL